MATTMAIGAVPLLGPGGLIDGLPAKWEGNTLSGALYALVLSNSRIMDPESGLDTKGNVGIADGKIQGVELVKSHWMPEEMVDAALNSDLSMIASDDYIRTGKGHPRTAGIYSRILDTYVRERGSISLMDAIRKSVLMPAQRLEALLPQMKNKERIKIGADADIVVFDPDTVIDRSTYAEPVLPPSGIAHVVVNGTVIIEDQQGVAPGRPLRAGV